MGTIDLLSATRTMRISNGLTGKVALPHQVFCITPGHIMGGVLQ